MYFYALILDRLFAKIGCALWINRSFLGGYILNILLLVWLENRDSETVCRLTPFSSTWHFWSTLFILTLKLNDGTEVMHRSGLTLAGPYLITTRFLASVKFRGCYNLYFLLFIHFLRVLIYVFFRVLSHCLFHSHQRVQWTRVLSKLPNGWFSFSMILINYINIELN